MFKRNNAFVLVEFFFQDISIYFYVVCTFSFGYTTNEASDAFWRTFRTMWNATHVWQIRSFSQKIAQGGLPRTKRDASLGEERRRDGDDDDDIVPPRQSPGLTANCQLRRRRRRRGGSVIRQAWYQLIIHGAGDDAKGDFVVGGLVIELQFPARGFHRSEFPL